MNEKEITLPKITLKNVTCPVCKGGCHTPLSDDPAVIGSAPCSHCRGLGVVSVIDGNLSDAEENNLGMANASAVAEIFWSSKTDYDWELRMLCEPLVKEGKPLQLYEAPSSTEAYVAIPASMIEDYKALIEASNLGEEGKRARLEKLNQDAVCYSPNQAY